MSDAADRDEDARRSLSDRGTEAIGEIADALLENRYFNQALEAAFGARDKALGAQRVAMGALNISSADEIERLDRRVRKLSERVEALEDEFDRLSERRRDEGGA
jgi:hypothetical protein